MTGLPVVVFDGLAYGMLLFLMSVGLAVTLGLMGLVNLAHGAFAAGGGYVAALAMSRAGVPFLLALPLAALAAAVGGVVLERLLFRRLYGRSPLDQVLFTVGLVYVWIAAATAAFGAGQQPADLPGFLQGQVDLGGVRVGLYRLVLIGLGVAVALALALGLERTRIGALVRASVEDAEMAGGVSIRVGRLFALTFTLGAGLAGLGGALAVPVLGLDPTFPLKYLAYFLIVVCMGGAGTVTGSFLAAAAVGLVDVAGKYYLPEIGAFAVYGLAVAALVWRPNGVLRA
ncbi:branched-chain amino acid ABC transporter permease [Methylobacterium oryzihabitans]|uniref:Branched-chain amino acid ABC transporter permease n=1 Tax=Methylobacterium oryzihabitans TaxID=2499852 RepID=A0A437NW53_9HYPH|nr:branched-chain amino acid ABC transporter permease [Methylobacterium oryzihabitans]RVU14259.1 branched-chain amino acid ABC transporter permease [Methylobacterium oryzihabitans]